MANEVPTFAFGDYVKFFSAGALACTLTHGVCLRFQRSIVTRSRDD